MVIHQQEVKATGERQWEMKGLWGLTRTSRGNYGMTVKLKIYSLGMESNGLCLRGQHERW